MYRKLEKVRNLESEPILNWWHFALYACERTRCIYKVTILQGRWRAKKENDPPLTNLVTQDVTLSFICKGCWGADAVCNVLLCAQQWVWAESCVRDYIPRPRSHFLCLHSLSGQMSLLGFTLSTEVKSKRNPWDLWTQFQWYSGGQGVLTSHDSEISKLSPCKRSVLCSSQLLKHYSIFESSSLSFSSIIIPVA